MIDEQEEIEVQNSSDICQVLSDSDLLELTEEVFTSDEKAIDENASTQTELELLGGEKKQLPVQEKYKFENFDNPYDLLLAIMDDNKLDLKTVRLSEITDQYIKHLHLMQMPDFEQASEFLQVAATLLEIKTKRLLPVEQEEAEDEEDPEKMLLRKLEEYKILKEASEEMRVIENVDRFYKPADESVNDYRYVLKQMNMDNLMDAFTKMMIKMQQKSKVEVARKIQKDRFTVADKIANIKDLLMEKDILLFSELFESDYSRGEIISTFQALLELMKMQYAKAVQTKSFDDIQITVNKEYNDGQIEG